jgi:hypothetical protein
MNLASVLAFIQALAPLVAPTELTIESIVASIKAAGGMTGPAADADLTALVTEALAAKQARDLAAAGGDPQ